MPNPDMMRAFSADPSNKLPGRPKVASKAKSDKRENNIHSKVTPRRTPMRRGKRPRLVSESQQADTDVTTGIMAERISFAINVHGVFPCECKLVPGAEHRDCTLSWTDPEEALEQCHPHHHEKRRKGPKANRRNVFKSRSRPSNIYVVSAECHEELEQNAPRWSSKEAS